MEANSRPGQAPITPLRTQIARLCVLGRYLTEALDLQHAEPSLREHVPADQCVFRALTTVREQTSRLDALAQAMPGGDEDLIEPSASLSGLFLKCFSKQRARAVPDIINDDQAMLRLAMEDYGLLHQLGLNLGEIRIAELAWRHLEELGTLIREMKDLLPGSHPEQGPLAC
jgi:hypothetical protein